MRFYREEREHAFQIVGGRHNRNVQSGPPKEKVTSEQKRSQSSPSRRRLLVGTVFSLWPWRRGGLNCHWRQLSLFANYFSHCMGYAT